MALRFTAAAPNSLSAVKSLLTGAPLTISAWGNLSSSTIQIIAALSTNSTNAFVLQAIASNAIQVLTTAGTSGSATTSTTAVTGSWFHACGVFTSPTARAVFLNGRGKGTGTTNRTPTGALSNIEIGRRGITNPFDGSLAEVAIWKTNLSDIEVLLLASGFPAYWMRQDKLVFYAPLYSLGETETINALYLVPNPGSTRPINAYDHPTITTPFKFPVVGLDIAPPSGPTIVDAEVTAVTATATAEAIPPVYVGLIQDAEVEAAVATATAEAIAPFAVGQFEEVLAAVAEATAEAIAPTFETGPDNPTNLTAVAVSSSAIDLDWTDVAADETGYKIERSLDGVTFTEIDDIAADSVDYSDIGLAANTTYYYRVGAYNGVGVNYSNIASARTAAASPEPFQRWLVWDRVLQTIRETDIRYVALVDGVPEPDTVAGVAWVYVDQADGKLKCKFGDGFIAILADDS